MINAGLTDRLAVSFKDHVRSAHFQVKRRARSVATGATRTPIISRQVAIAADVIIGHFGSAATKFSWNRLGKPENIVFPDTLSAYFFTPSNDGWKFSSEMYHIVTDLVHRFGKGDCLIYEASLVELYIRMIERYISKFDFSHKNDERDIYLCAALAAEFASLRPIKAWIWEPDQTSSPRNFLIAPNQYVALVTALSIAVKSRADSLGAPSLLSDEDIVNLVDFAVDARFADLSGALKSRNSTKHLTEIFLEILPFIG